MSYIGESRQRNDSPWEMVLQVALESGRKDCHPHPKELRKVERYSRWRRNDNTARNRFHEC